MGKSATKIFSNFIFFVNKNFNWTELCLPNNPKVTKIQIIRGNREEITAIILSSTRNCLQVYYTCTFIEKLNEMLTKTLIWNKLLVSILI